MKKKLFFFGVDSATWDLIKPWANEGKLPTFKKLLNEGTNYTLNSTIPPLTPVAWPTMMTGASPAQHGMYDFYRLDRNHEITINLANDIQYPFVWELLSRAQKKVALLNIPITFPLRPVKGVALSSILTPGLSAEFIFPPSLKQEFLKRFPQYHFTPQTKFTKQDPASFALYYKEIRKEVDDVVKAADWILQKADWDFTAINFMAVDHVQHFYWRFMQDKNSFYRDAILHIYQAVDVYLAQIIKRYSKTHQIMVASDHGAGPLEQTMYLNVWLYKKGYLQFNSTPATLLKRTCSFFGVTPEALISIASRLRLTRQAGKVNMEARNRWANRILLSYADIDWHKTQAYSFGMYGGIFINKNVPAAQRRKLTQKIIEEMKHDFAKELTFIGSSVDIYQTKRLHAQLPDIQFLFKDGALVSTNLYAFCGNKLFSDPITHKSGEHRREGILSFYPALKNPVKKIPDLLAITPTILSFFGIPTPDYCKGTSLLGKKVTTFAEEVVDEVEV